MYRDGAKRNPDDVQREKKERKKKTFNVICWSVALWWYFTKSLPCILTAKHLLSSV